MRWVAELSVSGGSMAQTFAAAAGPLAAGGWVVALVVAWTRPDPVVRVVRVVLTVAVSLVAAVVVKEVVPRPVLIDVVVLDNSFPSGTVTAVAGAVAAVVLATARDMRVLMVAPGVVAVIAASYTVVALQWHRPSDVIGALLLVGGVTLVVSAVHVYGPADAVFADAGCERLVAARAGAVSVHDEGASGRWRKSC